MEVDIYDPWADPKEVKQEYGLDILTDYSSQNGYGAIKLAVAHNEFQ
jgi:UDP-N-acetyl-D-glucosamine/UDP-N-acetyl-D-galactosamine dehydrogenase